MSVGYDKYPLNYQCVLDLTFEEMGGLITHCRAQSDIVATLVNGASWQQFINGLQRIEFDPAAPPDFLEAPTADTGGLDFTAEEFSLMVWVMIDSLAEDRTLFCRGLLSADGWHCSVLANGTIIFFTSQAGAFQQTTSAAGAIVVTTWYLIGFARSGDSVRIYRNGADITDTEGDHIDPLTSGRDLHIGVYDTEIALSAMDGRMHRPRAWSRLLAPWEFRHAYDIDRQKFP